MIEQLPELVVELLEKLGYSENEINSNLQGEQVHILNVERDEDVLVYLCHVAERLIFGHKLNERIDNVCAPKKEAVQLARQKLVSAFIKFFS